MCPPISLARSAMSRNASLAVSLRSSISSSVSPQRLPMPATNSLRTDVYSCATGSLMSITWLLNSLVSIMNHSSYSGIAGMIAGKTSPSPLARIRFTRFTTFQNSTSVVYDDFHARLLGVFFPFHFERDDVLVVFKVEPVSARQADVDALAVSLVEQQVVVEVAYLRRSAVARPDDSVHLAFVLRGRIVAPLHGVGVILYPVLRRVDREDALRERDEARHTFGQCARLHLGFDFRLVALNADENGDCDTYEEHEHGYFQQDGARLASAAFPGFRLSVLKCLPADDLLLVFAHAPAM